MSSAKRQWFSLGLNVLSILFITKKDIGNNSLWRNVSPALAVPAAFVPWYHWLNSSTLGQSGRHFTDDIFRFIFANENFCILIKISLRVIPEGPIDNNPVLDLAPIRQQAIIWANADQVHWRIYVALGRDELMTPGRWMWL